MTATYLDIFNNLLLLYANNSPTKDFYETDDIIILHLLKQEQRCPNNSSFSDTNGFKLRGDFIKLRGNFKGIL